MDGRNSAGRRISLLNESEAPSHAHSHSHAHLTSHTHTHTHKNSHTHAHTHTHHYTSSSCSGSSNRLPSLPRSLHSHSRTSSYASSPVNSPQTPPLTRSDSSDSNIMQIPSPITPDFAFDPALTQNSQFPSPPFGKQQQVFFPPLPKDGQQMPYPAMLQQQQQQQPQQQPVTFGYPVSAAIAPVQQQAFMPVPQPHSAQASSSAPTTDKELTPKAGSSGKPQSKKNQYPCPMAKQYNCSDYFTTSGHAARHAKKHTGRKDALCPECNKAFTRKDNMEQHRRTHQNGRNAQKDGSESSSSAARKVKPQPNKRPRPAPLQPSSSTMTPIDPLLPTSPGSSIAFSDAASLSQAAFQGIPSFSQYIEPIPYRYDALPSGFTTGLDTLAIVATDEDRKRKLDE